MKMKVKEYLKFIFALFIFFILPSIIALFIKYLLPLNYDKYFIVSIYDVVLSIIQTILIIILYKDTFKEHFKKCKITYKNSKIMGYLVDIAIGFCVFLLIKVLTSIFSSVLATLFGIKDLTSNNQSTIETILGKYPIGMIISATILAPIIEETIFRRSLDGIIKNKKVFITVSGFIFGMMHVIDSNIIIFSILLIGIMISSIINSKETKENKILLSIFVSIFIISITNICLLLQYKTVDSILSLFSLKEMIASITYIAVGVYLAYIYKSRENIYYNIGIHALNNIFSIILLLCI